MINRQREIAADHNRAVVRIDALHRQRNDDLTAAIMTRRNVFSFDRCAAAVCNVYKVPCDKLLSADRHAKYMPARRHLYWLLYNERSDLSLPQVGKLVDRDHSTVCHGIHKFNRDNPLHLGVVKMVNDEVWRLYHDDKVQKGEATRSVQPTSASASVNGVLRNQPTEGFTVRSV